MRLRVFHIRLGPAAASSAARPAGKGAVETT